MPFSNRQEAALSAFPQDAPLGHDPNDLARLCLDGRAIECRWEGEMVFEIPSVAAGRNQIQCETSLPNAKKSRQKNLFPAGTPSAIINRLNAEIGKIVKSAEVRNIWKTKGVDTVTGTPAELGQELEEDYTRVGQLLMDLKIKK